MIGLRSRRVGITSTVLLVILALLLTWLATRAEGETLRKAELNDGGVWVTTSAQSRFGRINKPAGQLDAAVAATSPDNTGLDIVQDGAAVVGIVKATNQATPINVRTGILQESSVLTLPTPVPGQPGGVSGTIDVRGGTIATIDPATGKLRVQRVDSATGVTTLDKLASTAPPVATIGAGATVAVAVDGTVYAVSASSGQLAVVSPLPTGGFADANVRELGFTANSAQLTVVGDRWVIFDPSTGLVRADGEGRHLVQEEVQAVVVVEHHHHIGPDAVQPGMDGRKTVEEGFPVGLLLQALVDRSANGGNVGCAEAADELCHGCVLLKRFIGRRPRVWP